MPDKAADERMLAMLDTMGRQGFAYAWQMLRHREDALDAVQTALTSVWSSRQRLQPGRDPRGWFYRTLRNKCVDLLRARRAHRPGQLDADPPATNPRDPVRDATQREELVRLRRALEELPDEMREIVLLRDYHDLSYAEVAEVLRIPVGTVMSRLHRARSALRQWLREGE